MSENPIFDALRREVGYRDLPLFDAIAARAADAFLTDSLLAHTVDRWASEVAAADVLRLWDGGDLDE